MAIPRLNACLRWYPSLWGRIRRCFDATRLLLAAVIGFQTSVLACGASFEEAPPTLPYYLDRLPAKPPSEIFRETFPGNAAFRKTDFKAALLALASDCLTTRPPAALLAATDKLLVGARLDPDQPAALCNLLNDVRDLFAVQPPVPGYAAAAYIRWRVDHVEWFHLSWDGKPLPADLYPGYVNAEQERRRVEDRMTLSKRAADPVEGPLAVHWLYLRAAYDFPKGGAEPFQRVIDLAPDHPRAEAARFMLARCRLVASRSHGDGYGGELKPDEEATARRERTEARTLFKDYLKRYPKGRFAADVPGWLGGIAFSDGDYLHALDCYLQQADVPDHPELLKSAGFMCERCLSRLADSGDQTALRRVAAHPRLAMSLIYLLVDATYAPANDSDGQDPSAADAPARVNRWRRDLLPRLAAEVVAQKDAYADKTWQPRYLTILAQAASGVGDQKKALALCDMAKDEIQRSDDLAFVRLVALERARRLPEAVAAGREFARWFPKSPFAPAAILRVALALQDDHQAGAAVGELSRLQRALATQAENEEENGTDTRGFTYPPPESLLTISHSVLHRDTSGAENAEIAQLRDSLLNFAPLPELAAALSTGGSHADTGLDGADEANLRAVLVQRWLAEEENFAEAKKYATPAQWSIVAANLEKLTAEAASAPAGVNRANAALRLADGWAAARGHLIFAPLETDKTRAEFFSDEAAQAGLKRRENGLALGWPTAGIDYALSSRDEGRHAFDWWLRAADAVPAGSAIRAHALWSALRIMPSMALASPYTFLRAGETDASSLSRKLCERLRRECPESREARQFAVYYDLAPTHDLDNNNGQPNLTAATADESLPYGEPEYRWEIYERYNRSAEDDYSRDQVGNDAVAAITRQALAMNTPDFARNPQHMAQETTGLRTRLRNIPLRRNDLCLVNFLDDLSDFLQEPTARLTPEAITRYLGLRMECIHVEQWGALPGSDALPPIPDATSEDLNNTVLAHIREAYREPAMAAFKDYLDFLAMAVVANTNVPVPIPGETEDVKDDDGESGKKDPVTYLSRDYPKLAKLAEAFLADYPHSRKREATRLLYARGLYAASRPQVREKYAVWPESGHFASGTVVVTHRQQPFDPKKIGAELNACDREFPNGRYADEIRNLRGLLAWRTQDWPLALDLTLRTLADAHDAVLQQDASRRLSNIFVDGLTDDTERVRCLAAIRGHAGASDKLRSFLPKSPYSLRVMQSWVLTQL